MSCRSDKCGKCKIRIGKKEVCTNQSTCRIRSRN
ncbi:hypothetical protein [Flavobacterium sp. ABG]